jgi:hypothetical protein
LSGLPEDLQRVLEMAYNLYHRSLSKNPERLGKVSSALAPYGVALSDFKKFRIGYSPPEAELLSGYYREEFAKYPPILERFERLGLIREGRDALAGCVTFPVLSERARPEGLVGIELAGLSQLLTPDQPAGEWLFGLDKAAYGIGDRGLAVVAGSVLSFYTLYSILGAIGLEVAVGLVSPRLQGAGLERLLALGAEEVYLLASAQDEPTLAQVCQARKARLHLLPPLGEPAQEALERLETIAALTPKGHLSWMLRQAVAARREGVTGREGP